jgi:hypothetical protein
MTHDADDTGPRPRGAGWLTSLTDRLVELFHPLRIRRDQPAPTLPWVLFSLTLRPGGLDTLPVPMLRPDSAFKHLPPDFSAEPPRAHPNDLFHGAHDDPHDVSVLQLERRFAVAQDGTPYPYLLTRHLFMPSSALIRAMRRDLARAFASSGHDTLDANLRFYAPLPDLPPDTETEIAAPYLRDTRLARVIAVELYLSHDDRNVADHRYVEDIRDHD